MCVKKLRFYLTPEQTGKWHLRLSARNNMEEEEEAEEEEEEAEEEVEEEQVSHEREK